MNEHFIIKLITGEFVYGKLSKDRIEGRLLVVTNPLVWQDFVTEDGEESSTLVKYCTGTDEDNIPILSSSVISIAKMSKAFSKFYDMAVSIQKIMDQAYEGRLESMTKKMVNAVNHHYASRLQSETGEIIAYTVESDTDSDTIH